MGEVWRARDTKLARDVALKILPESFANDHDRLARFQREAQVLASLNHHNIAAIYGFENGALVSSWSKARRSPIGSRLDPFQSASLCRSLDRSSMRWTRRTRARSSTGT